jgi:TIR domain
MSIAIHRRGFDAFLSHAHVDKAFVNELYDWLTRTAGFEIWYDSKEMAAGTAIATGLHEGIEDCRALIVVGSEAALRSGWVRKEINVAQDEQARHSGFRLAPIIIGESLPDSELRGVSWIKAPAPELTFQLAIDILRALHPSSSVPNPRNSRDVYISASWHADDNASALAVCRQLASEGFRLIGDSKTQEGFSTNRIEEIIASCGALACVIPFRGEDEISAESGPYKYFVREINKANDLGLVSHVFADPRLKSLNGHRSDWVELHTNSTKLDDGSLRLIKSLHDLWRPPVCPHYVFLATDLDSKVASYNSDLRRLIESITGMPTVVGPDIEGENLPRRIIDSISQSFLTIAVHQRIERKGF